MTVSQLTLTEGGPTFSRLVLGFMRLVSWQFSDHQLVEMLETCLDWGITTVDHADIYGGYACERLFGDALAKRPSLRPRLQIITKCGIMLISPNRPAHQTHYYDTSKEHIIASVENSLISFNTSYLDLLLIHRPDPIMAADEVAEAFTSLKKAGKVLHFGVSNFTPWQLSLLSSRLDFPLVTNQVELSLLNMKALHDGTLDQCQQLGLAPMVWSPFAGGQIFTDDTPQTKRIRQTLREVGEELGGASLDQVALAWLYSHPARILPVLGTGTLERIHSAVQADGLRLNRQQWFRLWQASTGEEVP